VVRTHLTRCHCPAAAGRLWEPSVEGEQVGFQEGLEIALANELAASPAPGVREPADAPGLGLGEPALEPDRPVERSKGVGGLGELLGGLTGGVAWRGGAAKG